MAENVFLFPAKTANIAEFWLEIKFHYGKISWPAFELKYYNDVYEMNAKDAAALRTKRTVFQQKTDTKKTVFITLLSTFGAKPNEHLLEVVQNQLDMSVLFEHG